MIVEFPAESPPPIFTVLAPEGRTEAANAKRFVQDHGHDVRWCDPWGKWLVWDGCRWRADDARLVDGLSKQTAEKLWDQISAAGKAGVPHAEITAATKFARESQSARGIAAMLALARSEPGVAVLPLDLNKDTWLLACANCTVDLRTGKPRTPSRDDLLTRLCATEFDPHAECPAWLAFIASVFPDAELAQFIHRLFGYMISGTCREHTLPVFWGKGSNGKTTVIETVLRVLGSDFATKAPHGLMMASKGERHPTELATLYGKRIVAVTETGEGARIDEALIKELTGGDTIAARRMREDFWSFQPTHVPIISTNHRPTVRGTDDGIWRRLALVPFRVRFWRADRGESGPPEFAANLTLGTKLLEEQKGILQWLVQGCLDWQLNGLDLPKAVLAATNEYRAAEDVLGQFLSDECVVANVAKVRARDIYAAFRAWCERTGERALKQGDFGKMLTERHFERFTCNGTWYRGLGLVDERKDGTNGT